MICPLNHINSIEYGTKAHNLSVLINNDIPTVNGYCIKPGYSDEDILEIWNNLKAYKYLAVRSSMMEEDTSNSSNAGKFNTILAADSLEYVKYAVDNVFKNAKSKNKSIICQPMINSHISGVMFTQSPCNKNKIMIESTYGLGELLVSGRISPDRYEIDRDSKAIDISLGNKVYGMFINNKSLKIGDQSSYIFGDARCSIDMGSKYLGTFLTEIKKKSSLDKYYINKLVELGLKIEKIFGTSQDIEWAIDDEGIKILQSRNISSFMKAQENSEYIGGELCGLGVSSGVVKGTIIKNISNLNKYDNSILVVPELSPDVIYDLKNIKGIITQTGSMLCHAAIISRELKIPCIVGAKDALKLFDEFEKVQIDGSSGVITKVG